MRVFSTACPRNCYSTCSFNVHVENNRIVGISPQPANRATPEGICLKGLSYIERANSPDRIVFPLQKNKANGKFERISWEIALDVISEELERLKNKYGAQSILFFAASGISGLLNGISQNFWKLFGGCTTVYGNLCWPAGLEATRLTLGENKHNAPWDLQHAKLIIMWGKNAAETNIQEMIQVEKALQKGAKLIVIDPRRTPTAEKANLLLQPKPGTDAALALGVAHVLIKNNWIDHQFVEKHVKGFEPFKESLRYFTPNQAEAITGIPAGEIIRFARFIGNSKPMTIVPGYGMQRFSNGGQTIRCLLALQVLTGNIGKQGACWHYANLQSYVFDTVKEPESYYPPETPDGVFRRTVSMAKLGKDIPAQKEPELKMIWVERGNPVTQNPDTNNVLKAFRKMEFRVVVEQFMTDTAREADIVLPAKNMFEQTDIIGSYWNPYVQLRQKVVEPPKEVKPETEIYYLLAKQLGFPDKEIEKYIPTQDDSSIEYFLKEKLEPFPELSWEELKKAPQLPACHEEIAFEDMKFATPSGKIELYSEQAKKRWDVSPLPTYTPLKERLPDYGTPDYPLYLLTPNTKNRIHSQFGNLSVIKQFDPKPLVYLNPHDASVRRIKKGDTVKIFNKRGNLSMKAAINYSQKKGCVAITNGWWISQGGTPNFLSAPRETDMGYGTAFHDNLVEVERL